MAAIAVDTLMFSAIVPALPVYQREMGLSDTGVALIFAAFPVAQLLVAPLAALQVRPTELLPAVAARLLGGTGAASGVTETV